MEKLTAIIITKDEILNIESVINSVHFADEIIVVDSFSKDGTFEKALELDVTVIQRQFSYHAEQKNWAIPQAKHGWVLIVDADERVTPELQKEIIEVLSTNQKDVAFWIGRMNHFMGKRVNYSGWRNDKVIRLFKRDFCLYNNRRVHEEIVAKGSVGHLKCKLSHNTYTTMDAYIEKMNRYASKQAEDYDTKTGKLTPYHFVIKPIWGFIKHYIVQSGFRDGFIGLTIGFIQGYVIYMRYVKLWLLRRNLK